MKLRFICPVIVFIIISVLPLAAQEFQYYSDFPVKKKPVDFIFLYNLNARFTSPDYSGFQQELGSANIEMMNSAVALSGIEMSCFINRFFTGLNYHYSYTSSDETDTLELEFNRATFGLHFGYKLVHSRRFLIVPRVAIRWDRSRLINSDIYRKITLGQYLNEKYIDLRFNYVTASAGIDISYIIYQAVPGFGDFMSVGFYGGYVTPLNQKPWIFSARNRILAEQKVKFLPLEFGINFIFYTF